MKVFGVAAFLVMLGIGNGKAAPLKGSMNYEAYHLLNLSEISNKSSAVSEGSCLDHRDKVVDHGERYFPLSSDPCTQCTCVSGKPEMCISVLCSPPENCRQYHILNDKCCEFVCLDRDPSDRTFGGNGTVIGKEETESINATNLGLRLVASTVTSFLILALLLFMIHRLHQRRLLLMIRRFHARRIDAGSNGSQRFPLDDEGSVGYLVGGNHIDFSHCSEPPPPYTFWKPPETYVPPGEAPPPYEASIGTVPIYNGATIRNSVGENQNRENNLDIPQERISHQISSLVLPPILSDVCLSTSTSETSNSQQIGRHGRVASISSVSMMSDSGDTSSHTDVNTLRSDAHYEDVPVYMPNNVTVLRIGQSGNIVSAALCDEDLANGNILPNDFSPQNYDGSLIVNENRIASNSKKGSKSSNYRHKHHSCGEISNWKQNTIPEKGENSKRFSLQTADTSKPNKSFPDPTSWIGEGSETSSSSSPTYEQCTFSPSSSDSSSMEVDFHLERGTHETKLNNGRSVTPCHNSQNVFQQGIPCDNNVSNSFTGRGKNISFDRTLQHLRKFSLAHRKKKKRKDKTEREEANVCTVENNSTSENYAIPYQDGASNNPSFEDYDHIHKIYLNGQKVFDPSNGLSRRPASLCLVVRNPAELRDGRMRLKSISPEFQDKCTPVSATVVAVHCSAAARVNRLGTGLPDNLSLSPDSNPDSLQAYIAEQDVFHASSPCQKTSPSNPKSGISRSGSICSETGERRYHSGNSPSNIFACSHFIPRHNRTSNMNPCSTNQNKNVNVISGNSNFVADNKSLEDSSTISEYSRLHSRINNVSQQNHKSDVRITTSDENLPKHIKDSNKTQMQKLSPDASSTLSSEPISTRVTADKFHLLATSCRSEDVDDSCSSHL